MKKITTSTLTFIVLSTLSMAGGDIAPVEPSITLPSIEMPTIETPAILATDSFGTEFYIGAGYTMPFASQLSISGSNDFDTGDSTGMFVIGSAFNKYFGVEARWTPMSGTNDNYAIYAKPEWKITENWNMYALLGAGKSERKDIEFQAGAGLGYDFNKNWGIFADFIVTDFETEITNLNADTDTGISGNASFGFSYTF